MSPSVPARMLDAFIFKMVENNKTEYCIYRNRKKISASGSTLDEDEITVRGPDKNWVEKKFKEIWKGE